MTKSPFMPPMYAEDSPEEITRAQREGRKEPGTLPMGIAGDSGAERAANIIMLRLQARISTTKADVVAIINEQTAAPELLEALESAVAAFPPMPENENDVEWNNRSFWRMAQKARAAIAKANGNA